MGITIGLRVNNRPGDCVHFEGAAVGNPRGFLKGLMKKGRLHFRHCRPKNPQSQTTYLALE